MDEKEFNNTYAIPANYTDSGKLLGGMLETRNTIEAIVMLGLVGYPEVAWLHVDTTVKDPAWGRVAHGHRRRQPDAVPQPHRKVRLEPSKVTL